MNETQYGRYRIVAELGQGAMGIVYQAHDPQIDRMVALKVLRNDRVVDHEFVQRFVAEARAIGRLSHPNIVTVFDVGEDHGTIYIAMEFLEGHSLDLLIDKTTFSPEKVVELGMQVAGALDYAHQQGIVHRDIKPGNIIISQQGQVKVTDFGIARIEGNSGHQMTQMGEILGTPIYMPPEQVAGQPVDGRSDIYSLGVVLYELATGQQPFKGNNLTTLFNAIGNETPTTPHQLKPQIPAALSKVIMQCLNKSPGKRFQNGQSLSQALRGCFTGGQAPLTPIQPYPEKRRTDRTRIYLITLLGTLFIIGVLVFFFVFDREGTIPRPSIHAVLNVKSSPAGADIFLNGDQKGKTPYKVKLPYGKYQVRLHLEGYEEWKTEINLEQPGEIPLEGNLIPFANKLKVPPIDQKADTKLSTLKVQSAPAGAKFYLNGKYKGKTPLNIKLPYGKYEVGLQHEKYYGWEAQINLNKPGEIPLRVRLISED